MKVNIGKGGIKSFKKKCSIVLGKSKSFFVEIFRLEQTILKTFTHTLFIQLFCHLKGHRKL